MKQQRGSQIAAALFMVMISVLIPACGSSSGATATRQVSIYAYTPNGTSLPTPTPTPRPRPTAAMIVETPTAFQPITTALKTKATDMCQSAEPAQQDIASLPKHTLPEASILAFSENTWEKDAQWQSLDIPFVSAIDANGVHYLICILETRTKSGTYKGGSSGATGWKVDWDVTMLEYPSGKPVAGAHLQGDDPLYAITTLKDTKDIYGMPPTDALRTVLLDISAGKLIVADGYPIGAVAFSSDGRILLTCSFNIGGTTKGWDIETGQQLRILMGNGAAKCLTFSADGKMLATGDLTYSEYSVIQFWDISGDKARNLFAKNIPQIWNAAISPDGKIAAVRSGDQEMSQVILLDTSTWQEIIRIDKVGKLGASLSFSPDGKTIAVSDFKNTVLIFDVASGKQLRATDGKLQNSVKTLAFSPDGKLLAASDGIHSVKVWDAQTGQNLLTLNGGMYSLAFSPDSKLLAGGDSSGGIKLWDLATGKRLRYMQGHTQMVDDLVFSADGTKLASGSWDTTAAVWDVMEK